MDKTFEFDIDKINKMEDAANCLGAVAVTTMKLKDLGIKNDDIIPILRSLMDVDIEVTHELVKDAPAILDMVALYAKFQHKDMKTAIDDLLADGRKK